MSPKSREERERELQAIIDRNRAAFVGKYKDELDQLTGMSRADIAAITPSVTAQETYAALIEVVKEASRQNLAQAELKTRIQALGSVAVSIAKNVTGLAKLFV